MNSLIISALVAVVWVFHRATGGLIRIGQGKTAFCALWCIDSVFAVCGTVISFLLYHYEFQSYLTVRNLLLVLVYLLVTFLFVWLTPSGFALLKSKREMGETKLTLAECRLNDTLGMVRNCFLVLLFLLPILFADRSGTEELQSLFAWREPEVCGGLCFVGFLILVPMCIRQALYWLGNLSAEENGIEARWLQEYKELQYYRRKNLFL